MRPKRDREPREPGGTSPSSQPQTGVKGGGFTAPASTPASGTPAGSSTHQSTLPFTGLDLLAFALLGLLLAVGGVSLRRVAL